jgi:trans-2,3-dihydro-3-hydroxyanthranilate isomerase
LVSLEALARSRVIEPYWSQMTHGAGVIGAYLYAAGGSNPETGYRTRMYAPAFGIPEDPATGAAAAMLAAQLLASNAIGTGQTRIRLEQGYEMGRPSEITLETEVAGGMLKAVRVGGEAVRMTTGWLEL